MRKRCTYEGCTKRKHSRGRYCSMHAKKITINGFLGMLYRRMRRRTEGKDTRSPHLWMGKSIMPKDVFMSWAKNHPDFLSLYKRWVSYDFDNKLTPSVNRKNSSKGYTLDNVEWLTTSQNSALAGSVRHIKSKQVKAIRDLLGVRANV